MTLPAGYGSFLRKFALSSAFAAISVTYVLTTAGARSPAAPATAGDAAASAPAAIPAGQVRLGTRQIVTVKDGQFEGSKVDAVGFGPVRIVATFEGNKMVDVDVVEYPDHSPTSVKINMDALPLLRQEAIANQSAMVDVVSGATLTSKAWAQSLRSAIRAASRP